MRLFRNDIVRIVVPMMVVMGSMMFGASSFLPLFLQAVDGVSATMSGLLLLPLMAGVTVSSISTGRITAATGRYRHWPILGTGLAVAGSVLLAIGLAPDASRVYIGAAMLLIGLGFGATMPTSTLAVQNSVEWHDLGVASSLVTFFRSLGGAVGLAVYGAIFNAQIASSGIDETLLRAPSAIQDLPPEVGEPVIEALADAVQMLFVVSIPVAIVAFVLSWFVKELPLRETSAMQPGSQGPVPAPVVD
jgi:predicted MFS family arabinose efflux permease